MFTKSILKGKDLKKKKKSKTTYLHGKFTYTHYVLTLKQKKQQKNYAMYNMFKGY